MREEIHKRIQDTLHLAGQAAQGPSLERCASVLLQLAEDHEKLAFELLGPPPIPAPTGRLVGAQREALPPIEIVQPRLASTERDRDAAFALLRELCDRPPPCKATIGWIARAKDLYDPIAGASAAEAQEASHG